MNEQTLREAIHGVNELPTLPSVLGRILSTAADPEASALDLGKHISADQSLSATLLKLVNSAYYGFHRQIKSLTQAIVMLGFLEVRNMALTASAFRILGRSATGYDRVQLWRHSVASAMAAEELTSKLKLEREGCFEAGLLHSIGRVVLDTLYPDEFDACVTRAQDQGITLEESCRQDFGGLTPADAGSLLVEYWSLPEDVVGAIRYQDRPEEAENAQQLARVVALSKYIAQTAGYAAPGDGAAQEFPRASAEALGANDEIVSGIRETLEESRDKIDELIGVLNS